MMKNRFQYLMILLGLLIVGCEPMEDIHDEIDAELENRLAVAEADYTLTEDDYDDLELGFPNFNNEDQARELIPVLLSDKYPTYGEGSQINVGFDLYDPLRVEEYTLVDADYELAGLSESYFTGMGEIEDFLDAKYEQAMEGDYVEITYMILAEEIAYSLNADDFDLIGEELADAYPDPASSAAQYSNFDRRSDRDAYWSNDMIAEAIGAVISENFGDVAGQKYNVSYAIYDGSSGTESMTVQFDGNEYVAVGGTNYEFSDADYDMVGDEFADDYPGPAGNAAQFGSFDVRSTSDNYWNDAMLLEAINFILMEQFPAAAEGDKFAVTYLIYNGSVTTNIKNVVLEDGTFVIDEEASVSTIEETTVFAYTNDSWSEPFVIPSEAYTEEFGQRFSNFGDEEEALTTIATYLGLQFPYSQEGDFKAVSYQFYNGEATVTEYANFMYSNGAWMAIPDVISSTLQFGYEDGMWVPDNTINYLLGSADYSIIADALAGNADYATAVASMERYGNFDRRPGASAYWSDEMVLEAMVALLNEIAPNAEVGQKYVLTFDIYNGSNTTESIRLIKNEAGEWVINE